MNWFFDQTLYGTGICDYRVTGLSNRKFEYSDSLYSSVVEIQRIGEVTFPVEILVHFSDGEEELEIWDGKNRYKEFSYTGYRKVEWVKIDPDYRIRMDVNFINNSTTMEPDRLPVRRFTGKLIALLQLLITAFSL